VSQQHRHEYAASLPRGLPGSIGKPPQELPNSFTGSGTHRLPAQIRRVRAGVNLRDVKRRFLSYSSPSRSPDPHHLAVLTRPGFVRAAPALPGTTRTRLPSAPPTCCDRISGEGLPPPLESTAPHGANRSFYNPCLVTGSRLRLVLAFHQAECCRISDVEVCRLCRAFVDVGVVKCQRVVTMRASQPLWASVNGFGSRPR